MSEPRKGLIGFELTDPTDRTRETIRGRGWRMHGPQGTELVLVGSNGAMGLGMIAFPTSDWALSAGRRPVYS